MDDFRADLSAEPEDDHRARRFAAIETFIRSNERVIHAEQRGPSGDAAPPAPDVGR